MAMYGYVRYVKLWQGNSLAQSKIQLYTVPMHAQSPFLDANFSRFELDYSPTNKALVSYMCKYLRTHTYIYI